VHAEQAAAEELPDGEKGALAGQPVQAPALPVLYVPAGHTTAVALVEPLGHAWPGAQTPLQEWHEDRGRGRERGRERGRWGWGKVGCSTMRECKQNEVDESEGPCLQELFVSPAVDPNRPAGQVGHSRPRL
jgi:hypothetical protein